MWVLLAADPAQRRQSNSFIFLSKKIKSNDDRIHLSRGSYRLSLSLAGMRCTLTTLGLDSRLERTLRLGPWAVVRACHSFTFQRHLVHTLKLMNRTAGAPYVS